MFSAALAAVADVFGLWAALFPLFCGLSGGIQTDSCLPQPPSPSQEAAIKTSSAACARLALSGHRGFEKAAATKGAKLDLIFSILHPEDGKREEEQLPEGATSPRFLASVAMKGDPASSAAADVQPSPQRSSETVANGKSWH